jgi:hypothetical protein
MATMQLPERTDTPTEIDVLVGTFAKRFRLYATTAPRRYDSGTVLTIHEDMQDGHLVRWVLIPLDQVEWQIGRNSSGLYPTIPTDDFDQGAILERLLKAWPFSEGG